MEQAFCPHCGASRQGWVKFCGQCGNAYEAPPERSGASGAAVQPPAAAPSAVQAPSPKTAPAGRSVNNTARGCLAVVVIVLVLGWVGSQASQTSAPANDLTATFDNWEPVDDGNGYAYFSITNRGTASAVAKCTVTVKDDLGDFGFDSLVGETVGPGQTVHGKMAISVGKGSYLVNTGTVDRC